MQVRLIMPTRTLTAVAVFAAALVLAACTSQALWRAGQQWQRQECGRLKDPGERQRCERSAVASYQEYRAESAAATTKKPAP